LRPRSPAATPTPIAVGPAGSYRAADPPGAATLPEVFGGIATAIYKEENRNAKPHGKGSFVAHPKYFTHLGITVYAKTPATY
jgi:hypothetical protein